MSITGNIRRVAPDQLKALLAAPEQVQDFIYGASDVDADEESEELSSEDGPLPLEKNWHALHFLLTGTSWGGTPPLNFIAVGGQKVGDEDVGYGPARAFTPQQVKDISRALEALDPEALRPRFNPGQMDDLEIYPKGWSESADDDSLESLLGDFDALKLFLREGAEQGLGLLVYLN
ncbi:MAG: YfbM family protein [Cystobacter sp.]